MLFLPPVGESPVLRYYYNCHLEWVMFLPPVGESPVLSVFAMCEKAKLCVSTPCRGITCAEDGEEEAVVERSFPPPVGESPVLR